MPKRFLYTLIGIFMTSQSFPMDSIFYGGTNSNSASTSFNSVFGNTSFSGTEAPRTAVLPFAGTAKSLYASVVTAPGVGTSRTFTIRQNTSTDTALTCTISDTATTCQDIADTVAFSAGDLIDFKHTISGSPASSAGIYVTVVYSGGPNQSVMSGHSATVMSTTTAVYSGPMGVGMDWAASIGNESGVVPTAGTIQNLYVSISATPGGVATRKFTYYLNGSASALTCTISNPATTCNDTTHSFAVSPGDKLAVEQTTSGTAAASATGRWAAQFTPTTDGENAWIFPIDNAMNTAGTQFQSVAGVSASAWTGENGRRLIVSSGTIRNFYVDLTAAPNTGKSYALTFRKNGASQTLTTTLSDAATTGNDTTHSFTTVQGDFLAIQNVATGTPDSSQGRFGFVIFNQPTGTTVPQKMSLGLGI